MASARRFAFAILLALTGSGLGACNGSTELRRVRTPREGVMVEYQLEKGQGYEGTLRVGNTRAIEGLTAPLSQTATCDVNMAILDITSAGVEVRATFTSVDLDWDLPPSATYSTDELLAMADKRLRGMQMTFVVRPDGRIQTLPVAPEDAPPELREIIETLVLGLEAFFVPTPPQALQRADEWTAQLSHETATGLRRELDQTLRLDGSYEHRSEALQLRRVAVEQMRREQRPDDSGALTVEREGRAVMMFSTEGYPVEVDREVQEFDPVHGMVFRKVRARWSRSRGLVPELIAPPQTGDVQVITDPCNADYVGPDECPGDLTPPPEGDSTAPEGDSTAPEGDATVPEGDGTAPPEGDGTAPPEGDGTAPEDDTSEDEAKPDEASTGEDAKATPKNDAKSSSKDIPKNKAG